MLVHRSTESLVIERLGIPATESPSVERDSFIFLDEDYWELEHDELSPVKTRPLRSRTMGTMLFWFLQLPQERVHTRVHHSWSEESPEGTCPTICDLGRCPLQKVLQGVLALPYLIGRRSAHSLNKLIQMSAEDTSTAKCLPRKSWGKDPPPIKSRVSRDVRNVHSFDGIFFQNAASCRMAGPSSIPKVFAEWKKRTFEGMIAAIRSCLTSLRTGDQKIFLRIK